MARPARTLKPRRAILQRPPLMSLMSAELGPARPNRRTFLKLCPGEPFRIFFPLGLGLGIVGVALWPLYFAGVITTYPPVLHARLMIEGMMAAFIFGFLGTAGPRLTETAAFSAREVGGLLALQLGACVAHLARWPLIGDALFLIALLCFVRAIGSRFHARSDLPPPNFVLVALGLISGMLGTGLIVWTEAMDGPLIAYRLGSALLNQAFVLFPVLGAGAFLLRMFLAQSAGGDAPVLRAPSPAWSAKARLYGSLGAAVLASFALDAFDFPRMAGLLRALALGAYLVVGMPIFARPASFLAHCLRLGLVLIVVAQIWLAIFPFRPLAGLHIEFIGGFSVIVFTVGTRVIFGHGGQAHLLNRRLPFLVAVVAMLILSLLTRIGADFVASSRAEYLVLAAVLWLAAALLWGIRVLRHVATPDAGH